jgi:hypothetical protein
VTIALYMDHHVSAQITDGLRLRGVDCLTAWEDGSSRSDDELLLERATQLGRTLFSMDADFLVITHHWRAQGRPFAGLVSAKQGAISVGQAVRDLELIAKAFNPQDMLNHIEYIPFP